MNRRNQFKQLTTVQADLIFRKLTGLEKPKSSLDSLRLTQSQRTTQSAQQKRTNGHQVMNINTFVKALALVGSQVYGGTRIDGDFQLQMIHTMIGNTLVELNKQIAMSERGMNTNAATQIAKLLEILQDESIVNVLNVVHKTMLPFY